MSKELVYTSIKTIITYENISSRKRLYLKLRRIARFQNNKRIKLYETRVQTDLRNCKPTSVLVRQNISSTTQDKFIIIINFGMANIMEEQNAVLSQLTWQLEQLYFYLV